MNSRLKLLIAIACVIGSTSQRPNIVFILTDDQDSELGSLTAMPKLRSLIGDRGATFTNSFVATPLCCPSRSGILTGQYVHNHGTINNTADGGCGSLNWQKGPELNAFPLLMKNDGYRTFFAGKYLNTYGLDDLGGLSYIPPGWDSWIGLKGNSVYYNYYLSVNGTSVYHGNDTDKDYLTNVIKEEALNFIETTSDDKPFFMMLSTPASHEPFTPEPKYETKYNNSTIPRAPNFNIVNLNKNWFAQYGEQPLRPGIVNTLDDMYRNRLRTLMTVDDMIESIVEALNNRAFLNNTYIFFTSDNGYHLGQYSLPKDKNQPYECDIRVPLLASGPGIPEGINISDVITNIDLAPTFLNLAGIPVPQNMDGISMKDVLFEGSTNPPVERPLLIEHSGQGIDGLHQGCEYLGGGLSNCTVEFDCKCGDVKNNTYNCVRTLGGSENNDIYCIWDDYHFEEYYNITHDPWELKNNVYQLFVHRRYKEVNQLLKSLLICSGSNCNDMQISF